MSGILLASVGASFGGLPEIGAAYEGGFFAGQISTAGNGVATHNLVVAPKSSGENSDRDWKTTATTTPGTSSLIDGPGNTAACIAAGAAAHPAANFCNGLTIGGFSDWYLPAKNELEVCYYNLKPVTANNVTNSGTNINAVPSRGSNYTTTVPGQTIATDFQTGNTHAFASNFYWSSSQFDSATVWRQSFGLAGFVGYQDARAQNTGEWVRAIRRVAV